MKGKTKKGLLLKGVKDWFKEDQRGIEQTLANIPDAINQLQGLFNLDLAAWIREGNALRSAAARRAFIAPYKELFDSIAQKGQPRKGYKVLSTMNGVIYPVTQVIHGWLKNGHRYKREELLPPVTNEVLQRVQDFFPENYLPLCFIESYKIYGGIADNKTRLWGNINLAPIDVIIEEIRTRNDFYQKMKVLPFGQDLDGNTFFITLGSKTKTHRAYIYSICQDEFKNLKEWNKRFCDVINKNHKIRRTAS